ncbi:hypothetical protein KW797_03165, partial [Candidatus Parcubacteria bacterium]|nr:hypothetical protein [Candidatus Parcubacteria bacterium]
MELDSRNVLFADDFTKIPQFSTTAGLGDYLLTETNAGATETLDATENGGVLKGLHTAADPDIIDIISNWGIRLDTLKPLEPIEFGIRCKFND